MTWQRLAVFVILGLLSLIPIIPTAYILTAHGPIMFGHDPQVWIANDFGEISIEIFRGRDFGKDHHTIFLPNPLRSTVSLFLLSILPSLLWLHRFRQAYSRKEK